MATMNFNTANATFRQLLGNGLSYRVPPFQRDYSWTEDEWDDLWQDILGLFEADGESAHYMGYLVLQSADGKRFDIIDGQQRLTTISVMILACLKHLQALIDKGQDAADNARRKESLQNSYIGYLDPVSLAARSKLELNRHTNRFYQNYLAPLGPIPQRRLNASERQLRKVFYWFGERIERRVGLGAESGKALAAFIDTLVDRLVFTVITVTDELNAFKVFETLNARGVRLSATDLLKNYLFSVISAKNAHEAELEALEERWEHIVGLLGSESFPEFLRVFWNSRNRLTRGSELFKTISRRVDTRETAFDLLRNLDHSAEVYAALRDPHDNAWNREEQEALEQLALFMVRQPLAMLLSCHVRFYETKRRDLTRIFRAVAVLSFRFNVICNAQANDQERLYNDIAMRVFSGACADASGVIAALRGIYPSDELFKEAFAKKEFRTTNSRSKKVARYIFFELERQLSGRDFDPESATYTLEHVLPEHPAGEAWNHIEEAGQADLLYRLGNMTLLEAGWNRELGNSDYETKRQIYARSAFQLTRGIAEHYAEWNGQTVESRQKRLAEVAAGIWKLDFGG